MTDRPAQAPQPPHTSAEDPAADAPAGARRRWPFVLLLVPLLLMAWGAWRGATSATSEAHVLRLAHNLNVRHPVHRGMEVFAAEVARLSQGRLRVDIYADGTLGGERELVELVQLGSLAMTKVSAGQLEAFTPQMRVFSLPYLFDDREHFWRFATSAQGQALLDAPLAQRLKGLTFYDAGSRSFYFGRGVSQPVRHPDALRGLAIRVMPSRTAMRMVEAFGAKPVPIPFGELYSALDTGTVDAAENNPPSLYTSRQYEVASSYSLNEHMILPDVLVIGTDAWARLDPQEQGWLQAAARTSAVAQRRLWDEAEREDLASMREAGLVVVEDVDRAAFRAAVQPVHALPEFAGAQMQALVAAIAAQGRDAPP